jgi:hypothetical protein
MSLIPRCTVGGSLSRVAGWCAGPRSKPSNALTSTPRLGRVRDQVGQRRGTNIGKVAAARELIELVFYGLRDGEIRCLNRRSA